MFKPLQFPLHTSSSSTSRRIPGIFAMAMKVPSASLLRAMMHPARPICQQTRSKSDWMPREKYAKVTSLDKLHRKQKAEFREKRMSYMDYRMRR